MPNNKSYLKYLVGQTITKIDIDINTVVSLKGKKEDQSETMRSVYTQVYFSEYRLDIYNKTEIIGGINTSIKELIGLRVIDSHETDEIAKLILDNGYQFIVDLRDEAYSTDPEAMCLQGPNNLIVVWN